MKIIEEITTKIRGKEMEIHVDRREIQGIALYISNRDTGSGVGVYDHLDDFFDLVEKAKCIVEGVRCNGKR